LQPVLAADPGKGVFLADVQDWNEDQRYQSRGRKTADDNPGQGGLDLTPRTKSEGEREQAEHSGHQLDILFGPAFSATDPHSLYFREILHAQLDFLGYLVRPSRADSSWRKGSESHGMLAPAAADHCLRHFRGIFNHMDRAIRTPRLIPALVFFLALFPLATPFSQPVSGSAAPPENEGDFKVVADRFADIQVLRYRVPGFEDLSVQQKKLAYYLTEAGFAGRDIFYDQKYKHNLLVRKTLEAILRTYSGDRTNEEFQKLVVYAKRVFFSNGIHHHYSSMKFVPECSRDFFDEVLRESKGLPLDGRELAEFTRIITPVVFDPELDKKAVDLSPEVDNVKASAVNFYEGVTEDEVIRFYEELEKQSSNKRLSFGLNSKVTRQNGKIVERVWRVGGMYDAAIRRIIYWLNQALDVAENDTQKAHLQELIKFYETGDLEHFDKHSILWVKETEARIDVINGFIEVYQDPLAKKGAFESVVSMRDLDATKRIASISKQAQWFEDQAPIMPEHKKENVVGISAKVITVIGEAGDAAPSTPIGINLPNPDWIRAEHGSKSVTLGNIIDASNYVRSRSPATEEFSATPEIAARIREHGALAATLHVDMHEVIGHASGKLNEGVAPPDQTLKTYASALEEARADLVALYYALDPKLVEIGVMPSTEVGKAEYDQYLTAGLMTQLFRVEPGQNLEQAHMRNRQLVSSWVYEKGRTENVIQKIVRDGKTYFQINDYEKLRQLFGQLLREIQRIKSEGDYEAGMNLVETYGVKVDQELLQEVHRRYATLDVAPYQGFIQPRLVPVLQNDEIKDVKIEYPEDFLEQMLEYGEKYAHLPIRN
jgi:dipeptidyl-peptidase III